jgi:rhodanese-related sulfurtransferase
MKKSENQSTNVTSAGHGALRLQAATLLGAALLLGVIYNHASPLGVRAGRTAGTAANGTSAVLPPAPPVVRSDYFNETMALTLETPAAPVAPAVTPVRPVFPATLPANPPALPLGIPPVIPTTSWAQVKPLLAAGKIVLVDARAKATYEVGHIPGARSLPSGSSVADVQAFARTFPPNTVFVTYCSSETCGASRKVAEALVQIGGLKNVSDMTDGYAVFLTDKSSLPAIGPAPK